MEKKSTIPEIEAMRMGVDYSFSVSLRRFTCILRPLANSELLRAYASVHEYVRKIPESRRTKIEEDNALARELLKLASADYGKPFGTVTDTVLDEMTTEEIMFLYSEWQAICDKVNPRLEELPVDVIKEMVEDVKKNTPKDLAYQLTGFSFWQMRSILRYLLTKEELPKDSQSGG